MKYYGKKFITMLSSSEFQKKRSQIEWKIENFEIFRIRHKNWTEIGYLNSRIFYIKFGLKTIIINNNLTSILR